MDQIGANAAMEEWIDDQFALPATLHEPLALAMMSDDGVGPTVSGGNQNRYRDYAFFHTAIAAPDQLRQRMAWALIQIFVVNQYGAGFRTATLDASGEPQNLGIVDYYDMLLGNAFGNYRQLVEDVTFHPIMGVFLSHVKNPKGDPATGRFPDENYARELLQLFSIGLYELQQTGVFKRDNQGLQVETYDNESIKSFARVFTGLSYAGSTSFYGASRNYHEKMVMYENYHDPDAKVLLRGESLPAGLPGVEDIGAALDNVFSHPNVPPFIARLLIQRFVKSNPSKGYTRRVANAFANNGAGVRGDFEAVLKAILLDKEALASQKYASGRKPTRLIVSTAGTEHSRLREPILRYVAFVRAFNPTSTYLTGRFMMPSLDYDLNQGPYRAPHVFNFYLPNHRPPGDLLSYEPSKQIPNGVLFAPEFEIQTAVAANRIANRLRADVRDANAKYTLINNATFGRIESQIYFDFTEEALMADDPAELMAHLDLLLCHGSLSDESRQAIDDVITDEMLAGTNVFSRTAGAILAVLTSSECAVDG